MQATAQAIAYPDGQQGPPPAYGQAYPDPQASAAVMSLYPSLEEYMGMSLSPDAVQAIMPEVAANPPVSFSRQQVAKYKPYINLQASLCPCCKCIAVIPVY